jgi:hypothetical protein
MSTAATIARDAFIYGYPTVDFHAPPVVMAV